MWLRWRAAVILSGTGRKCDEKKEYERSMEMTGFVDISSLDNKGFSVYLFRSIPKGYEFERHIKYSWETMSSVDEGIKNVEEFYLSIPLELLDFRILKLPFSDREKLNGIIPFELGGLIIGDVDSVVFDFVVLGSSDGSFDVLVAYAKKEIIRDILERLSSLNIDPKVITSVELKIKSRNAEEFAAQLAGYETMDDEMRINAAREEIIAHTINLRTGPFAYTKDMERLGKALKATYILSALLALVIISIFAFRIVTAKVEASSTKKQMKYIYVNIFPAEKKITDELYQMKSHIKDIKDKRDALTGVYPLELMLVLSQKPVQGAAFNEVNIDREIITIKGEAASMDDIDRTKRRLSEFLSDVSISDIKPSKEGKTLFTAVAKALR